MKRALSRAGVCDREYCRPGIMSEMLRVDRALEDAVLDRLNRLPTLRLDAVCAGHARNSIGNERAYVLFSADWFNELEPVLRGLSCTEFRGWVEYYRLDGQTVPWWRLHIDCDRRGRAPREWWYRLVDALESA